MIKLGNIDDFKSLVSEGRGFAKSNLYYIKFPTIAGINGYNMGLFCSSIDIPTRQLNTVERVLGVTSQNVVYGYTNPAVNASFNVMNDQKVRTYFENWMQYILPEYNDLEANFEARYPDTYVAPVHIYQLRKEKVLPLFSKNFDKKIGPINLNIDIDIDIGKNSVATYHWVLDRAFPVSMTSGSLSDAGSEISQVQVEFNYLKWVGESIENQQTNNSIFIN